MDVLAWCGLVTSWVLVLLVIKYVFLVLRLVKQIRRLAEMSRDAAMQLSANLTDAGTFAELGVLAEELPEAARGLASHADDSLPPVSSISPGIGGRIP